MESRSSIVANSFFKKTVSLGKAENEMLKKHFPQEILEMVQKGKLVQYTPFERHDYKPPYLRDESETLNFEACYVLEPSSEIKLRITANYYYSGMVEVKQSGNNMYLRGWHKGNVLDVDESFFKKTTLRSVSQETLNALYIDRMREVINGRVRVGEPIMAKIVKKFVEEGKIDSSLLNMDYVEECLKPVGCQPSRGHR